ncbi:hypothetical protein FAJ35_01670 [Streptococcus suis]|uniref:Uncharacterized protein n=1 Tax=Streptococcus suis TaxID=1307 RepID=A0A4V6U7B2_STRSU|nr:hypothetical protein FAJ35_01670 [Streptococcus suis]
MECKTRIAEICFANPISNLLPRFHASRLRLKQFPELFHSTGLLNPINHCAEMLTLTLRSGAGLFSQPHHHIHLLYKIKFVDFLFTS